MTIKKQIQMLEQILDKYSDQNGSEHLHPSVENPIRIIISNIRTELETPKKRPYIIISNYKRNEGIVTPDQIEIIDLDKNGVNIGSFENFNIFIPMDLLFGKAMMYMQAKGREPNDPEPQNIFGE